MSETSGARRAADAVKAEATQVRKVTFPLDWDITPHCKQPEPATGSPCRFYTLCAVLGLRVRVNLWMTVKKKVQEGEVLSGRHGARQVMWRPRYGQTPEVGLYTTLPSPMNTATVRF